MNTRKLSQSEYMQSYDMEELAKRLGGDLITPDIITAERGQAKLSVLRTETYMHVTVSNVYTTVLGSLFYSATADALVDVVQAAMEVASGD